MNTTCQFCGAYAADGWACQACTNHEYEREMQLEHERDFAALSPDEQANNRWGINHEYD